MQDSNLNDKPVYLSTGVDALNEILSMDVRSAKAAGGILIGEKRERRKLETPIILISGTTGTGKTTLALQTAFRAATDGWLPFFYALEQSTPSLQRLASNFGCFKKYRDRYDPCAASKKLCDLADPKQDICFDGKASKVYRCYLSPRPISEAAHQDVFEERFAELRHMVKTVDEHAGDRLAVFFIDSLNAFSSEPLGRDDIYRLYSLFRSYHIPAVLTVEQHQHYDGGTQSPLIESARFLADVAIALTKDSSREYQQYSLEIEKSRVSRQGLGRHLYKIRTRENAAGIELDPRTGIVLYPSVHSVLSRASEARAAKQDFHICESEDDDLARILAATSIKTQQCLTIVGPPGTHKLALGMNLAMGYLSRKPPRLLIVNFGGSGDFGFGGVAWTKSNEHCGDLEEIGETTSSRSGMKFWRRDYSNKKSGAKEAYATILTFKIGQLTPEECVYIIDSVIKNAKRGKTPFSSVLLSDTGELCSGFPLLVHDPLFLPALVDIFAARNLVTVCIGVDTPHLIRNAEINFSLSSRADYRIMMSHYPEKPDLYRDIVRRGTYPFSGAMGQPIDEQLVGLVIDNVTGKHYGREPKWLWVEEKEKNKKTLHCEFSPHLRHPKFQVCIEDGEYYFRLSSKDGTMILRGKKCVCGSDCIRQINLARTNANLEGQYRKQGVKGQRLCFTLIDDKGEIIGHSREYESESQLNEGIRQVMRTAPDASIENPTHLSSS